jgi:ZIP family zinc transporter
MRTPVLVEGSVPTLIPSAGTWAIVLFLALLSGLTTLLGVILAIRFAKSAGGIALGLGFSAGIMLVIAGAELVPAALRQAGAVSTWGAVALGAAGIAALHVVIPHVHLFEERGVLDASMLRASTLVALGLILHDFPEGIAMANAYVDVPSRGILVAIAIALHNVPEQFAMAVPAVMTQRRRMLVAIAFVSALAEPAGALVGLALVQVQPALNAFFIALAAGAMIFVSGHELVPMAARLGNLRLFGAGLALSVPVYVLLRAALPA